jgi:hypothetical protein
MRNMNDIKIHQTNILPLRWFANMCGSIACRCTLKCVYLDEAGKFGIKYTMYHWLWKLTWPPYMKWGTTYKFSFDMSGPEWDDYDENGVPYWEKTGTIDPEYVQSWQFEDPWTGDAFRLIKK